MAQCKHQKAETALMRLQAWQSKAASHIKEGIDTDSPRSSGIVEGLAGRSRKIGGFVLDAKIVLE